jgi:hypothetical protein
MHAAALTSKSHAGSTSVSSSSRLRRDREASSTLASSFHAAPRDIRDPSSCRLLPRSRKRGENYRHEVRSPQGRRTSAAAEGNADPADAESSRKAPLSRNLRRTLAGCAAASAGAKVPPGSSFTGGEHERVQEQTPSEPDGLRMIIGKFR